MKTPAQKITGAFHPKIALGIDEGLVRLLVGSHNLTEHGAKLNLEITGFYEIPLTENNTNTIKNLSGNQIDWYSPRISRSYYYAS